MSMTLCLPKSSRLFVVGSKEASWEELAWEPPCNGIFIIHPILREFLQPFQDLRITTRVSPFYRGFLFIWFWGFVGLDFLKFSLIYHQPIQTQALERWSLLGVSSLSRTELSPTVGEEGEDEEEEEWLSCFIGVREIDEDAEEEHVKPGTTIGTKFFRVSNYPKPVFNEMWFFDHWSIRRNTPFSSQSIPSDNTAGVLLRTFIVQEIYPILWHTQLPLLHWRLWLS